MKLRSLLLVAALLAAGGPSAAAERPIPIPGPASPVRLHAFTLQHQPASEALELVRPLLSKEGTVTLAPGSNTLEIRDTLAALSRIVPMLRSFDHPARPIEIEVLLVQASRPGVSGLISSSPEIPQELITRWRELLHYDIFTLAARADLRPREGESVTYETGNGYKLTFRLGTVLADRRIRLHNFRIVKRSGNSEKAEKEVIHTNLNLWLDQTITFGLARTEASPTALMVVMTCRKPGDGPEPKTEGNP